jgi:hypothetical protein
MIKVKLCDKNVLFLRFLTSDNTSVNNDLNRNDKKKMQTIDNVKYPSIYKYFH